MLPFPEFLILCWWTRTASVSPWAISSINNYFSYVYSFTFSLWSKRDVCRTRHAQATESSVLSILLCSPTVYITGYNNNWKIQHVYQKVVLAYLQVLTKYGHKTRVPCVTEINFHKQILPQIALLISLPSTLMHALNNLPKLSVLSSFRIWRQA